MLKDLKKRYTQWFRAEFVPWWIQYASVYIYASWKALSARNILWFTATNPGFEVWGLYPSSKWEILRQIPNKWIPGTYVIESHALHSKDFSKLQKSIADAWIDYPMIIKPDNGLRGLWVEVLHTPSDFQSIIIDSWYFDIQQSRGTWLIQEFINHPLEVWVFYVRIPWTTKWTITWIVAKEFLQVIGNWNDTLWALVSSHSRAWFHISILKEKFLNTRDTIPEKWSVIDLVEIWTHSKWSTFVDASEYVNNWLIERFDEISSHIKWFYYGRYDIRVASWEALQQWDFKIIELNTTYSEPTWMYDPSYSFIQAQRILIQQYSKMYQVATANHNRGVEYATYAQWKKSKNDFQEREGK